MKTHDTDPTGILKELDRCVMCGMCTPHCPTYRLHRTEAESPRGRVQLMAGAWRNQLPVNAAGRAHLDACLLCRACETVCPAEVPFESLMNRTRERIESGASPNVQRGLRLILNKARLRLAVRALRWYRGLGIQALARASGLLRALKLDRADALLPTLHAPSAWRTRYATSASTTAARETVALFTGCVTDLIEHEATRATIDLLNTCGFDVAIPPAQTCCGALHAHSGDLHTAMKLRNANHAAFAPINAGAILSIASGCTTTLLDATGAGATASPYQDACAFFADRDLAAKLDLRALPRRAVLHTPCSQRRLGGNDKIKKLLSAIPELNVATVDHTLCCGAAGSHMLTHSQDADALMALTIDAIAKLQPELIITTNVGCSILMQHALRQRGLNVEIVHPLTLLQRQCNGARDILEKTARP